VLPLEQRINSKDWNSAIAKKVQGDYPLAVSLKI